MGFSYSALEQFILPGCDRLRFIVSYLNERNVQAAVMPVDGKNHIYVVFPRSSYNTSLRIKTVIAHYDRAPESPGANDNSFAVIAMLDWACRLAKCRTPHNVRMIFTDGEEMSDGSSRLNQGAYSLAQTFRRLGIDGDDIFVFDCMGRGTVPVLGKVILPAEISSSFRKQFTGLYERTFSLLQSACGGCAMTLPVSYSDNAGFIASGIPAVCVTMLPLEEAAAYASAVQQNAALSQYVMNKKCPSGIPETVLKNALPYTWRLFHTPYDNAQSITPHSAAVFERILQRISEMKTMEHKK